MKWRKWHSIILFLFLIFSALSHDVYSQADAKVRFLVQPGDSFIVRVDNDSIYDESKITLPEGEHNFKVWAPNYKMVDTTVVVHDDTLISVILYLRHPAEWYTWKKKKKKFAQINNTIRTIPFLITLGSYGVSTYHFFQYRKSHFAIADIQHDYEREYDSWFINETKNDLEIEKGTLEFHRKKMRTFLVAGIVSTGVSLLVNRIIKRKESPKYIDLEKIEFEGLSYSYEPTLQNHVFQIGINIKL